MRFLLLFLLSGAVTSAAEVMIPVSPEGSVKTLAQARDEVRKQKAAHPGEAIRVQFAPGRYALTEAVPFTAEDSGTATAPVVYEGSQAVFDAGTRITGWKEVNGLWQAPVPKDMTFEQLWINGRRATPARSPNVGYFNMYSQAGSDIFPGVKDTTFKAFVVRPADYEVLKTIKPEEKGQALLTVMHTWTVGQFRIDTLHDPSRSVLIKGRSRYPFVQFEADQRWYIENIRSALDAPGEWFLDRAANVLLYKPLPGEDMAKAEVVAPVAEQFIVMNGTQHVMFKGLSFQHGNHVFGPEGHHDGQAASAVAGAIDMSGVSHIQFTDCEIARVGLYGVFFRNGCADCSITHSRLHDLGGGGVRIGDIKMPKESELTQRITVDDCIIQQAGRIFPSACGVFLAHAADCTVTHNDIGDLYYTGISAGWVWGYSPSPSKRNRFDYNHLHHIGWGVLSDMGGFYSLGRSEGTTVNHNYVHHVAGFRYGGWGLYTDEGSTGVTMENNLVHDTTQAGFHQHYGKWNRVMNNIFAFGKFAQFQRSRAEKHASFQYENNIVYYATKTLLDGGWYNWETGTYEMRNNCYWNAAGLPVTFIDTDLAGWQKRVGRDEGSVVADPLFVDAEKRNFTLKPNSPALKTGFKPFDASEAGVRKTDAAWRKLAESLTLPDWEANSQPWPAPEFALKEDFEFMGLGMPRLPRSEIQWENKGDKVEVTEAQAHSGKRSLMLLDAPNLAKTYDPHLVIKPKFKDGTVRTSFALRFDPGVSFYHEWRSEGHPYTTGPSFWINNGKLSLSRDKPVLDLPADAWIGFEVTAALGDKAGKWSVKVTLPDGSAKEFNDLPAQQGWSSLEWMGFVSDSREAKAFYIDDLKIVR